MDIKAIVQEKYGEAARRVAAGEKKSCCGDPITNGLYSATEAGELPETAVAASLGCGNPTALAQLGAGETVLDLGSGGGIDVLLSARRVGPSGKAYGLDMTDDMLALARENQKKAGVENVEFLRGEIENIPLPEGAVDVVISNCVINLSGDKDRVLREAFRVLKPGGRFAVSDVVLREDVPEELRQDALLWAGCVAGALSEREYREKLAAAGFAGITLESTREYEVGGAKAASMFVRAVKPSVVEVFDPAMCCSTGVCGPAPNPVLPRFAADLDWLAEQGMQVTRHNLAQEPAAFAGNPQVAAALAEMGTDCLPLIIVNGAVKAKGKYPVRYTLAGWAGLRAPRPMELPVLGNLPAEKGCC